MKKLSKPDRQKLWGDGGPYSEVHLIEQSRILDTGISRVFLIVEMKINPFTFEYFFHNRQKFQDDHDLQELLDHAEFRGASEGYVVMAGEEELKDKRSSDLAFSYRTRAVEQIVKMHKVVIEAFALKKDATGITIKDPFSDKYIWDEQAGLINTAEDAWDSETYVSSPSGSKNGKIRYFIVLALIKNLISENDIHTFAPTLKKIAAKYKVEIEEVDGNSGYILVTALIAPNIAPGEFIESSISAINKQVELFKNEYFISNVNRPSWNDIQDFLRKIK